MSDKAVYQEFVEYIVKQLVNHPEDVKVEKSLDERGVLLTLYVNPQDMGFVIGRKGQVARAIRTLLRVIGARNNAILNLKIHEPGGSNQSASSAEADEDTSIVDGAV